jgi:hypothetical protein
MLPLLPTLALVGIVCYADAFERALGWLGRSLARRIALAAVLVAFVIPQVSLLWNDTAMTALFAPIASDTRCPADASISAVPDHYYGCIISSAWRRSSTLLEASKGIRRGSGPLYVAMFAATIVALVLASTGATGPPALRRQGAEEPMPAHA